MTIKGNQTLGSTLGMSTSVVLCNTHDEDPAKEANCIDLALASPSLGTIGQPTYEMGKQPPDNSPPGSKETNRL